MRIHVIGAGLAGLAAAWRLAEDGYAVTLYEAAPQAGGRCRSFLDLPLDRVLDNGGHVLLGANTAALGLLRATGGIAAMSEIAPAAFPFHDLSTGESWTLRPNAGPLPWWILNKRRRVPGSRAGDYLAALSLLRASAKATVADCLPPSTLTARLWEPFAVAVMNALPADAAAAPLGRALLGTFGRGERGCRAWIAKAGLSAAFVDPTLRRLGERGGEFRPGWRLARLEITGETITALSFDEERIALDANERVVLAVPPSIAADLLPGLTVPDGSNAIVNAHYRLESRVTLPGGKPLLGLIGGNAQWLIARDDIVSVTVSGADALVDRPNNDLLDLLWSDVGRVLDIATSRPAARLIKERRATFAQNPANQRRRPATRSAWRNLFLAGDWTDTGLPATIEGAVQSGLNAARAAMR
jgi:hydroxysqualene dehydroxylase